MIEVKQGPYLGDGDKNGFRGRRRSGDAEGCVSSASLDPGQRTAAGRQRAPLPARMPRDRLDLLGRPVRARGSRSASRHGWGAGTASPSPTAPRRSRSAVAALGLGPGDEVILPSFTIISCAAAVLRAGAMPVVVDCDPRPGTWRPTRSRPRSRRGPARSWRAYLWPPCDMDAAAGPRRRAIGWPSSRMPREVLGQTYRGAPCGSFGDVSTFSFYPNKLVTTGEGGMIVTDDDGARRALPSRCATSASSRPSFRA